MEKSKTFSATHGCLAGQDLHRKGFAPQRRKERKGLFLSSRPEGEISSSRGDFSLRSK
jgi:hypothetical protein